MRIIAGELKGREIRLPKNSKARPLTGATLEQLMSLLSSSLADGPFLDLCAGSGIAGFEALSRGAPQVVFVETDSRTATNLRQHVAEFGLADRAHVLKADVRRCFKRAQAIMGSSLASCCLLDPPFIPGMASELISRVGEQTSLFRDGAVLICRTPDQLTEKYGGLTLTAKHDAGSASLWVFGIAQRTAGLD